jgi:hypothetical protein
MTAPELRSYHDMYSTYKHIWEKDIEIRPEISAVQLQGKERDLTTVVQYITSTFECCHRSSYELN